MRTRRTSAAERLAARFLGRPEEEEVVDDVTPSAVLHAERYFLRADDEEEGPPAA